MKPTPPLWKHQEEAISLATSQSATLFHMGMGTGKSRCAIEVALRTKAKRVLVLCPLSVCEGWKGQFNTFAPNYRVTVLNKKTVSVKAATAQRDDRIATAQLAPWVCVVNYESARSKPLSDWLMLRRFDLVVIDECHRIKSPAGATSRWVSRLAQTCKRRLGLTGTPMRHRDPHRQLPSEGATRGAIQVPPNGLPVILGPDHPVTGGYPVAGVVVDADIDKAAQIRPGQTVRLHWSRPRV